MTDRDRQRDEEQRAAFLRATEGERSHPRVILAINDDSITVGLPSDPVPLKRGAHQISPALAKIIARSTLGDDEWRRRWTWPSVEIAIQSLVAFRADGQPMRSPSRWKDPKDRIDCERRPSADAATALVDRLVHVDEAIGVAYTTERVFMASVDEDGQERPEARLDVASQQTVLRLSVAGGDGFTALAHYLVAERMGLPLTDRQVAIVRGEGVRSVAAHLRAIGELEPAEEDKHVARRAEGKQVPLPGLDVEGWGEISKAVGLSVTTCQKLAKRAEDPLPYYEFRGVSGVFAKAIELDEWARRQIQRAS